MLTESWECTCDFPRCRNVVENLDSADLQSVIDAGWKVVRRIEARGHPYEYHYCPDHAEEEPEDGHG